MNNNEPFIKEIETETGKTRANITQTDLEAITALRVTGASDIPANIDMLTHLTLLKAVQGTISSVPNSVGNLKELKILNLNTNHLSTFPTIVYQLPKLEELQLNDGTIEEIPATITNMASHLKFLTVNNNRLVKVPTIIFSTNWSNSSTGELDLFTTGNQIVTDIPANYVSNFNNGQNMLEFYDGQFQKQDQLTTTPGYTIDVPVGTDFNQLTPDKTKLALTSGRTLLAQHEFEYYDDGSSSLIHNGVAAAPGQATIFIKSKFSTQSNKFARTQVTVNIAALNGGPITVKHEDTKGQELAPPVILNGKDGDPYTTTQKTFPGYTLVATPANQNGTFTLNPATVNYVYSANDYKLTSTFKDAQGQELKAPVVDTKDYHIQDNYTTTAATIPGYSLVSTPANQNGTFGAGNVTVNYVYKKDDYTLTSTYKDTNGQELKAPVVDATTYHYQDTYTTTAAVFPGYTLVATPANETGTFHTSDVTVNYVYKLTDLKLTSTYKDAQGTELKPPVVDSKTYHIQDNYATTAAVIPGYTLVATPANQSGTFGSTDIQVNYVYQAVAYKLTSTYKDQQGNDLALPKVDSKTYHIQDGYTTSDIAIPGYTLVAAPTNQTGTFGASDVTVNYVYKANDYTLTSTYKDAQGKELKTPVIDSQKYHINDTYTTTGATIPGYTLVAAPANQTGTFGAANVTVNYVYQADDYTLTSTYKDANGKELKAPVVDSKTYHTKDNYSTSAATIPGYTLVAAPANQTGTFNTSNVTVNYVYKANEYTLTSTFKNVQGTELKPSIVKKGFIIQDGYASSGVTIPGYTLVATPSNKKGTFGASNVTVNYVYKANGYALITTYKDTQGNDLKPLAIDTKTYNINDPYTATALNIPGYTLTTTPANEKGVFGASDETVNYVYKANDYTLTTTYKDANGKELQAPKVDAKTYHIQDTYKTTAAVIPGYTLVATPKNDQGTFGANNVTVNYVYQTNDYTLTSTFKDTQGNELKAAEVDAQKYHIHDTYTTKAAVIPGYTLEKTPTNETGTFNASDIQVNYVYKANDYQLTSTFKDQQGNEIALPTVDAKTYHIHDAYTTKARLIPGYSLVAAPKNQIGAFGTSDVTVNYVYKKDAIIKPITQAKPTILTIKTPASKVIKTKVVKQTLPKTGDDDAGLLNLLRLIGLVLILGVFLAVGSKKLR